MNSVFRFGTKGEAVMFGHPFGKVTTLARGAGSTDWRITMHKTALYVVALFSVLALVSSGCMEGLEAEEPIDGLCPAGQLACVVDVPTGGTACVNPLTDSNNCGECGFVCLTQNSICVDGQCACPSGLSFCAEGGNDGAGACVNFQNDPRNCGACGNVCSSGTCSAGTCVPVTLVGVCAGKAAGTLCRAAASDCDVAEYCDGASVDCPADCFKSAGTSCQVVNDGAGTCSGSDSICRPAGNKCTGVVCPAGYACDMTDGACKLPNDVNCHGLISTYAQADITAPGVTCVGWGRTVNGLTPNWSVTPSTTIIAGDGICANVCKKSDGTTIQPTSCAQVWVANGAGDVARYSTAGCCKLPGHPASEAPQAGCAWDGLCSDFCPPGGSS